MVMGVTHRHQSIRKLYHPPTGRYILTLQSEPEMKNAIFHTTSLKELETWDVILSTTHKLPQVGYMHSIQTAFEKLCLTFFEQGGVLSALGCEKRGVGLIRSSS